MSPRARRKPALDAAVPHEAARLASLRHVNDDGPGITRIRKGKGFSYRSADGKAIRDAATIKRIKSLAIPPAWENVWISPLDNGHIQATGRDARGRKQYRYHPRWREVRDENKYARVADFGRNLPALRERIATDLARPRLPMEKAIATVVSLLESTYIRIGGREYARDNDSFGLTTMLDRHVNVSGSEIRFRFRGKSGKDHTITVNDRRIAKLVKQCRELPGQVLFQYLDEEDNPRPIDASDVNEYLRENGGSGFTAKDFRTWAGTMMAAKHLTQGLSATDDRSPTTTTKEVIASVAKALGNTATVCRKCYIHPLVLQAITDPRENERWQAALKQSRSSQNLTREESALIKFLDETSPP